jgi:hypothetical protein
MMKVIAQTTGQMEGLVFQDDDLHESLTIEVRPSQEGTPAMPCMQLHIIARREHSRSRRATTATYLLQSFSPKAYAALRTLLDNGERTKKKEIHIS